MMSFTFNSFFDSVTIFWSMQISILLVLLIWFYSYVQRKQSFWKKYGIAGPKPLFLLGTDYKLGYSSWPNLTMDRLKKYGKVYGGYQMLQPILYIHEPKLIKTVMIKDFHCFVNRPRLRTYHEMLNQNMLFSEGNKWKRMRTIASPSFSSGKLRNMTSMMNKCIDKLFNYFNKIIDEQDGIILTKKVIAGLTMDVIAWCGFSTETNANDDRQKENLFLKHGLGLFQFQTFRALAALTLPRPILNMLNIRTLNSPESFDYFINLTREIIRQRKEFKSNTNKKPNDLLQLMIDAEVDEDEFNENNYDKLTATVYENDEHNSKTNNNGIINKAKMTDVEIIANCIFFLIAGFETTSSTISHVLFELAWNPDVQQRLYDELKDALDEKVVNSADFHDIVMHHLPYLEAVLKETLRLFPPVTIINRMVSVDHYKLNDIPLARDTAVQVPVHAIHHCSDYYENPEHFDPNRWLPENKDKLTPYTFMPFGLGPRNCIGMRFAYQEVYICLARMVLNYKFETTPETPKTLTHKTQSPLLITSPFKLKIKRR